MTSLDVLCIGSLRRAADGSVEEAHATSTLIRAGDVNIVVDPSTEYMLPMVETSLRQLGVDPEDVDTVILTHTHQDHVENLGLYPKAKVYVHSGGAEVPGATVVDMDSYQVCPGVRMLHAPGHCPEECAVIVNADRRYACAGDAVPLEANLREGKPPGIHTDRALALASMAKIRRSADVIIPGHGAPFAVDSPNL